MTRCGCGNIAIGVIHKSTGKLTVTDMDNEELGRGTVTHYIPVCDNCKSKYPDYDGFQLVTQ